MILDSIEHFFETDTRYSGVDDEKQKKKKKDLRRFLWLFFEKYLGNPALYITENLKLIIDIRTLGCTEF